MENLQFGDIVFLTNLPCQVPGLNVTYKPPKGKLAAVLLLGNAEKKDPHSFDFEKSLKDVGLRRIVPEREQHSMNFLEMLIRKSKDGKTLDGVELLKELINPTGVKPGATFNAEHIIFELHKLYQEARPEQYEALTK